MSSAPLVPGYTLDRLIGEGGFGQVWHALRESDSMRVAIKVLHLELVRSVDALTRFQRELEAIARLQHPNVVRALGNGTLDDGRPYLVLEYLEGPSLRDVLQERGALPPAEMLEMFAPLCDALGVAHATGLVHRDVKASNVILASTPEGTRPVLLDFGLVKLIDEDGPGLTSSRAMLGTPAAMAPEQMRGQKVDARTDVYALGLLAFHMLTGVPAFGGAPGVVQSYLQIHGARPRPSSKVDIDPAIDEPIGKSLAPDPKDRYPTTAAMLEALRGVIHPGDTSEIEVVVLYAEGRKLVELAAIAVGAGMTIAVAAPDSLLAVAKRGGVNVGALREQVTPFDQARIAIGLSKALFAGRAVDGDALDVESWAPYPLPVGVWVADALL
ncbi:MAG TPA: serine/threonine-protein kinase [Kofleriaceae bacterium]